MTATVTLALSCHLQLYESSMGNTTLPGERDLGNFEVAGVDMDRLKKPVPRRQGDAVSPFPKCRESWPLYEVSFSRIVSMALFTLASVARSSWTLAIEYLTAAVEVAGSPM